MTDASAVPIAYESVDPLATSAALHNDDLASTSPAQRTWSIWSIAALWVIVRYSLRDQRLRTAAMVVALAVCLLAEPVRETLSYGQINLFLCALVMYDVLDRKHAGRGIWIGIAAGIKLTPLVFLALLEQVGLAFGFFLGAQLLGLGLLLELGLAAGDAGLEPAQRRVVGVGLVDQGEQARRLLEVLAGDALFGGDHRHRQQVAQCAGGTGVARLLVAQREVVLHRVVAGRRVQPVVVVGLVGGVAELVDAHRRHRGSHHRFD